MSVTPVTKPPARGKRAPLNDGGLPPPGRFQARFTTGGRIDPLEAWLKSNAKGKWSIQFDSASDDLRAKNYSVIFEQSADLASFRTKFRIGGKKTVKQ